MSDVLGFTPIGSKQVGGYGGPRLWGESFVPHRKVQGKAADRAAGADSAVPQGDYKGRQRSERTVAKAPPAGENRRRGSASAEGP